MAPPDGSEPRHLHRLQWLSVGELEKLVNADDASSSTDAAASAGGVDASSSRRSKHRGAGSGAVGGAKDLNILLTLLDDALYLVAGAHVHGWTLTERRRNERATKKLGKLEKLLGADVTRASPTSSSANEDLSNQVLVRAARSHGSELGPEIGASLAGSAALSNDALQDSLVGVLAALDALDAKNGAPPAKRRITQVRRADGSLDCTLDDIMRRSGAPTLTPQQRATAAAVLERRLAPAAAIVLAALPHDMTHACESGAPITCVDGTANLMFVGHNDGSITAWKAGRLAFDLVGHQGPILCLSAQDSYLVSAGCDDTVRVWETACGACVNVFDLAPSKALRTTVGGGDAASDAVAAAKLAASARRHALPAELQTRLHAPLGDQLVVNVKAAIWALEHFDRAMLLDKLRYAQRALADGALDFGPCRTPLPSFITQPPPTGTSARVRWYIRAIEWAIENQDGPMCREKINAALEAAEKLTSEGFDVASQRGQYHSQRSCTHLRIVGVALDTLSETSGQTYDVDIARLMTPTVHVALTSEHGSRSVTLSFDAATGRQLGTWKHVSTHGLLSFGVEAERPGDRHTKGAARVLHEVDFGDAAAAAAAASPGGGHGGHGRPDLQGSLSARNITDQRRQSDRGPEPPSPRGALERGRSRPDMPLSASGGRSGRQHTTLEHHHRARSPGRSPSIDEGRGRALSPGRSPSIGNADDGRGRALSPSRRGSHARGLSPSRAHARGAGSPQAGGVFVPLVPEKDETRAAARVCVSLSDQLHVRVWRAYTGRLLQQLQYSTLPIGVVALYRGPGSYLYTRTVTAIVVAYADSTIREWRVYTPSRYEPAAPRADEWSRSRTGGVAPQRVAPGANASVAEQLKFQLDEANRRVVELTADLARVRERESTLRAQARHDRKKIDQLTSEVRRLHVALLKDADAGGAQASGAAATAGVAKAVAAASDDDEEEEFKAPALPSPTSTVNKAQQRPQGNTSGGTASTAPTLNKSATLEQPPEPAEPATEKSESTSSAPETMGFSIARDVAAARKGSSALLPEIKAAKPSKKPVVEDTRPVVETSSSESSYGPDSDSDESPPLPKHPRQRDSLQPAADRAGTAPAPRKKIKKKEKALRQQQQLQQQQQQQQPPPPSGAAAQPPPPKSAPPPQPLPPGASGKSGKPALASDSGSEGGASAEYDGDDGSGSSTVPDDEANLSSSPLRQAPFKSSQLLVLVRNLTLGTPLVGRPFKFALQVKNVATNALVPLRQLSEGNSQLAVLVTQSLAGGMRMRQQLPLTTDKEQIVATLVPRTTGKASLLVNFNDEPLAVEGGGVSVDIVQPAPPKE